MYQISYHDLCDAIRKMNHDYPVVTPVKSESNKYFLKFYPVDTFQDQTWSYSPIRTPQPLKGFFYPPLQTVTNYPKTDPEAPEHPPMVIVGAKACDIHALKIIDKVYAEGEYPDPFYLKARRDNIIISSDCSDAGEFCACTLMNCQPYPRDNFDINLSRIKDELLLVEIGTDRGTTFFNTYFPNAKEATDSQLKKRAQQREEITEKVKKVNQNYHYFETHQQAIDKHLTSKEWGNLAKTCVECGTCTQICPTCHCFLLFDQPVGEKYERIKVWDSCFFAGYARMAGGLTPRLSLADRFKNRFYHKFDSFVTNFGVEACTGCGRCSEGCMGKIDLRQVLMELEKRVVLKEKLELA